MRSDEARAPRDEDVSRDILCRREELVNSRGSASPSCERRHL